MSRKKLEKTLVKEIEVLNDQIDQKIIRGISYTREARRHKFLVSSLNNIRRQSKIGFGWFSSLFLHPAKR